MAFRETGRHAQWKLWAAGLSISLAAAASVTIAIIYPQHLPYVIGAILIFDVLTGAAFILERKKRRLLR